MNVFSRAYIDSLYEDFLQEPGSLPPEWQYYFADFDPESADIDAAKLPSVSAPPSATGDSPQSVAQLQDRVDQLIRGYRVRGHLVARIDPLGRPRESNSELSLESYGLDATDYQQEFSARTVDGKNVRTLEELVDLMRQTYCRSIGVQFMHIDSADCRYWLQRRMEGSRNRMQLHRKTQLRILTKLTDAVIFEEFMRKKFWGAKTFSLEGAETLIPLLDLVLEKAGDHGLSLIHI